ncbi:MAG: hypothetical protein ACI8PZ_006772 [Myxococcota bacterium]|jgi:hypothetical protein
MGRVDDFIAVAADGGLLSGSHLQDGLLRSLVVHIAVRDGVIKTEEAELLTRVFPGCDQATLDARVAAVTDAGLDMQQLVSSFDPEDRPKLLTLAQAVARVDSQLVSKELGALLLLRNAVYG